MIKRGKRILKKILAVVLTVALILPILPQREVKAANPEDVSNGFYKYTYDEDTSGYQVELMPNFKTALNQTTGSYSGTDSTGAVYYWASSDSGTGAGDSSTNASKKLPNPAPNGKYNNVPVTNMAGIFSDCDTVKSLDLSNFDTSNIKIMKFMFYYCSSLTRLDLGSNFNTSNVTDTSCMFENCSRLTNLSLGDKFDTSNVTSMNMMFSCCYALTNLSLGDKFDTSNVTSMRHMFSYCCALTSLSLGDKFDTSNVTDMFSMFALCNKLESLDLSTFDLASISSNTALKNMFQDTCSDNGTGTAYIGYAKDVATMVKFNGWDTGYGVTGIDTSKIQFKLPFYDYTYDSGTSGYKVSLSSAFKDQVKVATGGALTIGSTTWTTGDSLPAPSPIYNDRTHGELDVTSMEGMFSSCIGSTSLDLSKYNTKHVKNMNGMFMYCWGLTSVNLTSFDTSNVTDFGQMFQTCPSLLNLDLSNFDLSSATSDDALAYMFDNTCSDNGTNAPYIGYAKNAATVAAFNNATDSEPDGYSTFLGNTYIDSTVLTFQVKPAAAHPHIFTPVTDITEVPASFDEDTSLTLSGTVSPSTATNKTITWSIKDTGETGATLDGNILTATDPGTVTVTATVKNGTNYTTDYTKDFELTVNHVIQKPGKFSLNATTLGRYSVRLTWSASKDAASYKVYRSKMKNGPYIYLGTVTKTTKVAKKLSANTKYWFKVMAVNKAGTTISGKAQATTKAEPVSFTLTNSGDKTVTVQWTTVKGAAGYQISHNIVPGGKLAVRGTVEDGNSFTSVVRKAGKTYQFKMRYYKMKNGKRIYSAWTAIQKIKID